MAHKSGSKSGSKPKSGPKPKSGSGLKPGTPDEHGYFPAFVGERIDGVPIPYALHKPREQKKIIPWDQLTELILVRLVRFDVPAPYKHGNPRQIILSMLKDARDKLEIKASDRSLEDYATALADLVSKVETFWKT
jgi:hypothetical protein